MGALDGFTSESQNMTLTVKEKETNRNSPETQDEMYQPALLTIPQNSWKQSGECAVWI